jgi:hypothetical protein
MAGDIAAERFQECKIVAPRYPQNPGHFLAHALIWQQAGENSRVSRRPNGASRLGKEREMGRALGIGEPSLSIGKPHIAVFV